MRTKPWIVGDVDMCANNVFGVIRGWDGLRLVYLSNTELCRVGDE